MAKNPTSWSTGADTSEPWPYDDEQMGYDDNPVRGYDELVPVTNELNDNVPTSWEQTR